VNEAKIEKKLILLEIKNILEIKKVLNIRYCTFIIAQYC